MQKDSLQFVQILSLLVFLSVESRAQNYKAAVVEYKSIRVPSAIPKEVERQNLDEYLKIIRTAQSAGAQIIVFPENGLTTLEPNIKQKTHLKGYSVKVPEPGVVSDTSDVVISELSQAAKNSSMYVVVNVLEGTENEFYSTNVVFDPTGRLIKKCRKQNLYNQPEFSRGKSEPCEFVATFGATSVSFGLVIGPDILYYVPVNVDNVILSTATKNFLPLEYSLSLHTGYAMGNDVNLLVSGYTDVNLGYGGTGIYCRNGTTEVLLSGDTSQTIIRTIQIDKMSYLTKSVRFAAKVPVNPKTVEYVDLPTKSASGPVSLKNAKCHIMLNGEFRYLDIEGSGSLLNNQVDYKVCAIVNTTTKDANSVSIQIPTGFRLASNVIPLSLGSNMLPFDYTYTEERKETETFIQIRTDTKGYTNVFGFIIVIQKSAASSVLPLGSTFVALSVALLHLVLFQ